MSPKNTFYIIMVLFTLIIFSSCSSNEEPQISKSITETESSNFEHIASSSFEIDITDAINIYRTSIGKSKLERLNIIKIPALEHTNYMIDNNVLNHDNFNTRANFLIESANGTSVAENVAFGYDNVKDLKEAWLDSDSHKKNIEGDFTHFEIIARKNTSGVWYFTNIFIKK